MERLLQILNEIRPDIDYETNTRLIDDNLLDSFDIVAIVSEINDLYNVSISAADIVPENFNSAGMMMRLIDSRR